MSYLVLARKYRPQRFADLVGQEHVARTLTNAIQQNRVHHAFLFTGARGVGKTSAARILAKALCCEKGPTAEPCGVCEQCQEIAGGRSVDVIEIDAASNTKVEETKSILEGVRYAPARARMKVYIIDEVHMLSSHSFNALLKTLEEPPAHVVFIFATTEVHKIPVTILSRTQRFDFKLISTARLTEHLAGVLAKENIAADEDAVRVIARQAAGSVRDGLSLLDQAIAYVGDAKLTREIVADVLGVADRRLLVELAGHILARDAGATLRSLARAVDGGVDLGQLARAFLGFLRDLEIVARVKDAQDLVDATPDELREVQALVGKGTTGLFGVLFDRWARLVDEAAASQTPRLLVEMAAVELCAAEPLLPIGDLLDRLEELEARLAGGAAPPRAGGGGGPAPSPPARPNAAPPAAGPRSWAAPPSPAPPPAEASRAEATSRADGVPPPATAPAAAPPAKAGSPEEAWRLVVATFEGKSAQLAARLAAADVTAFGGGGLALVVSDKLAADRVEKARAEIEQAAGEALGAPVRLTVTIGAANGAAPVLRSEVSTETDALAVDRKNREVEARQHPLIQKAQDVFNASLKEIKNLMGLPDIKGLLETARRIQDEVARIRDTLGDKTVTGETGGGLVRCVANGKGEVISITVDPAVFASGDKRMLEDLTVGAVNVALERARELAQAELGQATGGLQLPPGLFGADVFASPIARLVQQLAKLPGIGEKTAARLAFHILRAAPEDAAALAAAITDVKQKIRFCGLCCDLTETDPCAVCADARREAGLVCVVAQPQDVVAIERTGGYRGRYHVLHGLLSPLDGIGPEDLRVAELVRRCGNATPPGEPVTEVILATSSTVEGEATAVYLAKLLRPLGVRTSRIATGVPIGGELEYADQLTLVRAIDGRREM